MSDLNFKNPVVINDLGKPIDLSTNWEKSEVAVLPKDFQLHDLQQYKSRPRWIERNVVFKSLDALIAYVNLFRSDNATVIFIDNSRITPSVTAILDYHEPVDGGAHLPGRCKHTARYAPVFSNQWNRWTAHDGNPILQEAFANFLEDRIEDVVEPMPSDLMALVTTFQVKTSCDFKSAIRLDNGQTQLLYHENIDGAGAEGTIKVPNIITIGIPVFECAATYRVDLRLRYKAKNSLTFTYLINNKDRYVDDALKGITDSIVDKIHEDVQVFVGADNARN